MNTPKISVVSGTYNRLELLKVMVASVRACAEKLPYEIVIVDGGSQDGTQKWCKAQGDIVLVEQQELLGAIKAYNAGFLAASGEYVCVMNDDAKLVAGTLKLAADYLDAHPGVGQVAFENQVENSAPARNRAAYDGAFGYLYGQCCLTRRWLGNLAGWWGEGYRTYAGDTQLGLRVWELGYRVERLNGCAVVDYVFDDELRNVNNERARQDSQEFGENWKGRLPPFDAWKAYIPNGIWEKAQAKQLRTLRFKSVPEGAAPRRGMIEEFAGYGIARQVNQNELVQKHGRSGFQAVAFELVKSYAPDLLILQSQGPDNFSPETVMLLRRQFPKMVIVNFNGDARLPVPEFNQQMARACDLSLVVSPDVFAGYAAAGAGRVAYWPISFEPDFAVERNRFYSSKQESRIVFMGSNYGDGRFPGAALRREMVLNLLRVGLPLEVYGGGWEAVGVKAHSTYEDHERNAALYASATLGISVSHFDDLWGYTSDRLYMLCATGCPALVKRFAGMEAQGFVDGETCIVWNSLDELEEKARYYLAHDEEREAIGAAGRKLALERHSWANRVDELFQMLRVNAPVGCCGSETRISNYGLRCSWQALEQSQEKNIALDRATRPLRNGALAGASGMALVEYVGLNDGTETWYGAVTLQQYNFGRSQPVGYIDRRDLEGLLAANVAGRPLFKKVENVEAVPA